MTEAETKLAALEKPKHDLMWANRALCRAKQFGDAETIKAAQAAYDQAKQTADASPVAVDVINEASQAVLDERGEAHTEIGILPPDHGIRSVRANRALALALGEASQGDKNAKASIPALEKALKDAEAADAADARKNRDANHARVNAQ